MESSSGGGAGLQPTHRGSPKRLDRYLNTRNRRLRKRCAPAGWAPKTSTAKMQFQSRATRVALAVPDAHLPARVRAGVRLGLGLFARRAGSFGGPPAGAVPAGGGGPPPPAKG